MIPPIEKKGINQRIYIIAGFFVFFFLVILFKAVLLQVFRGAQLSQRAAGEYEKVLTNYGRRGVIYDTRKREMAVSIDGKSIGAYPHVIKNPEDTAVNLAQVLRLNPDKLTRRLTSSQRFVWIKRQVTPKEEKIIRDQEISGMDFVPEHSRYYPKTTLAAQVIGFSGIDGRGLEGVEFYYNSNLKGEKNQFTVLKDARGRNFEAEKPYDPSEYSGNNLILTIDLTIQYITEKTLLEAVSKFSAKSGMAIVMAPETGEVLAMANVPLFNPNTFGQFPQDFWRNRTITDPFEPGSTMKIFSAAGAIESGGCTPNTIFFCENGKYRIGKDVIHDTHPHGWLSLEKIVKYSSNIGAIKISEMIGPKTLFDTLSNFGFGSKTKIDCPGETSGLFSHYKKWSAIDAGAISYGHGLSVSAIQLITAASAIANKGVLMKPYIVRAITDRNGTLIKHVTPKKIRQAISEKTARIIKKMMQIVVEPGGTGVNAALEGYSVCGKTGTSKKIDETGRYTEKRYIASFLGFAPVEKPKVAILVVIDEPQKGYYGGIVAAPAFRKIAKEALNYMNVPPQSAGGKRTAMIYNRRNY